VFNLTTFFGLPAHPFFVHVPIILRPLCGIGAVAMAVSPKVRARYGLLIAGLTVVAGISTQFAVSSGQGLRNSVPESAALTQHIQIAESIRPLVLLLFLAIVAMLWLDRRAARATASVAAAGTDVVVTERSVGKTEGREKTLRLVVAGLAVVVAIGANVRLLQIGHTGAKATWSKVKVVSGGSAERGH
jgi:hypothetical protein